jgi:hypothetical protein
MEYITVVTASGNNHYAIPGNQTAKIGNAVIKTIATISINIKGIAAL